MEAQDFVKLVFQAMLGVGHAAPDIKSAEAYILHEMSDTPDADLPLSEPISDSWYRIHLASWRKTGLSAVLLAQLMILSAALPVKHSRQDVVRYCTEADLSSFSFDRDMLLAAARQITDDPTSLPSHSDAYRKKCQPHYRLVHARFARLLPILIAIHDAGQDSDRPVLVGIDGPCASGKTTIAGDLAAILSAPVIQMDDFFTPFELKTCERLSRPGGNAHTERFADEVGRPLMQTGQATYRPWSCDTGDYTTPVHIGPTPVIIVEGSYSLHPDNAIHYDVKAFIRAAEDERLRRIRLRNGEGALQNFVNRWIPMENHYFKAFSLPDQSCLIIDT